MGKGAKAEQVVRETRSVDGISLGKFTSVPSPHVLHLAPHAQPVPNVARE